MGMFDNETITDEFFTSESEQVEEESAESEYEENEAVESDYEVENEDESSEQEQVESPLIAGKFKSQDDLVNAYKNLEKQFTQSRQTKQTESEQQRQQQPSRDETNEQFWNSFNEDPLGVINYLVNAGVSQVTQPIRDKELYEELGKNLDKLSKSYKQIHTVEGLTSLSEKADEIAREFGNIHLAKSARVLNLAAQEVFGDSKADVYKKAKADGKKESDDVLRTKQEMSTITSSKKPAEKAKTQEDLITDAIMGFSQKSIFSGK